MPFLHNQAKKRDQIVAIDMGTRTTKAVSFQRTGERFNFLNYVLQDAPANETKPSPDVLGEHLKCVCNALGARTKQIVLIVGVGDSLLRHVEMPQVPVPDMRMMLKLNTKNYLQQELADYLFDCYLLPPRSSAKPAESVKSQPKLRVLVGGAKKAVIADLQAAAKEAGLSAYIITPSLVGPVNAFEAAQPEVFDKEVVALADIGFKNSSISILLNGELMLSRVVGIGGDRLTSGLAETMNISYAEAEGIKVGMPDEVQAAMQVLLSPLGRELRASIDFFEHQQDKAVSQVFISGGSARSEFILQSLQTELMVPCKSWNPATFLDLALPPQQMGEIEQVAPQLAVAIGGAIAAF